MVDAQEDMSKLALEALSRGLLDIEVDVFNRRGKSAESKYANAGHYVDGVAKGMEKRVGKLPIQTAFMKDPEFDESLFQLRKMISGLLDEKRAKIAAKTVAPSDTSSQPEVDVIETLLMQPDSLSNDDLIAECQGLFIGGQETSANTMATCLKLLSENPDLQSRLHTELITHLGTTPNNLPKYPTTNEQINCLKLLDAVIKETLRLHPAVGLGARQTRKDIILGGFHIPAHSDVMVNIRAIHHNPAHWPNPLHFDPDRWLDTSSGKNPHYLPFSAGPQICLGMRWANIEMRMTIARIVGRYRLELVPGQVLTERMVLTIGLKDGVRIKLIPRV